MKRFGVAVWLLFFLTVGLAFATDRADLPSGRYPRIPPRTSRAKPVPARDDVNAIGTRNVGGKRLGNWYSLEAEVRLGSQYSQLVDTRVKLLKDPVVTGYIDGIGQTLVRNSDAEMPFIIKVIDDPGGINPFSLPGGYLYVPSGLILAANDEAEVAGMMAHEIAHVTAHHAVRLMTRNNMFNLATMPLVLVGGWAGYAARSAMGVALPSMNSLFARNFEAEADYLGLQYMYKSGYDPQAYIAFLERASRQKIRKSKIAKMFSTYPAARNRVQKSEEEIASILPPRSQYLLSTSQFDEVKAHLAGIAPPQLSLGKTNKNKGRGPVLRRPTMATR